MNRRLTVVSGGREQYQEEQDLLRERLGSAPGRVYIPPDKPRDVRWVYWAALIAVALLYTVL